nr:hypothetical protein [Tanacetum cinerariifolium]
MPDKAAPGGFAHNGTFALVDDQGHVRGRALVRAALRGLPRRAGPGAGHAHSAASGLRLLGPAPGAVGLHHSAGAARADCGQWRALQPADAGRSGHGHPP